MLEVTRTFHIEATDEEIPLTFKVRGTGRAIGPGRVICGSLTDTENVKHFVGYIYEDESVWIDEGHFFRTINDAYGRFGELLDTSVERSLGPLKPTG